MSDPVSDGRTLDAKSAEQAKRTTLWLIVFLLLLAVLPYVNTLQNGFVYDDNNEVLSNPYIRSFSHLGDIFSTRILAHLGLRGATNYYRPISIFGFLICFKLFGMLPYGFHLANLVLHTLIVVVLFGLTKRLYDDQWLAFAAAAIFALHPIHTESVAWVSGVTDLDLAIFYLVAFWFFIASARPKGGRSEWAQIGMVVSFVLALLSKEQAVTLPLTAAIYEHFYRKDRASTTLRQKVERYASLWLLVPVYVLFRIRFFGAFAPVQLTRNVSWYEAFLSAAPLAGLYVRKMFWPVHLIAYYPFHKSVTPFDMRVLLGAAVLVLCALAFGYVWKRGHAASFGFVWFFLNIAPVLNSRWLGPNVFTERYLYLPSMGFCWVAAWAIQKWWQAEGSQAKTARMALASALVIVGVLAFARIVTRNRDWRSDDSYYLATLAAEPESEPLRMNLGAVYWNRMDTVAAEREWKKALVVLPNSAPLINNLGLAAVGKNHNDEAVAYFERSMKLRPNYTDAHLNLGRVYEAMGKPAEAELQFRAAVALAPLNTNAHYELGSLYLASGHLPEAEVQFDASNAIIPGPAAFDALAEIALQQGRTETAEQDYRHSISMDNMDYHAHYGLAGILATEGHNPEAADQYRAGLNVDPLNKEAQAALARLTSNQPHATPKP